MKILFTSLSLLVLFSASAFGWASEIASPEIGYRANIEEAQKKQVHAILDYMQNDLKFIEGNFINEFSFQRFGGTSSNVSRFIDLLEKVGIWEVQVQFRDFGEQESAFTFHQNSSETLTLNINSGRNDVSGQQNPSSFEEQRCHRIEGYGIST